MAPNQTQEIGHQKYPTYMHCSTLSAIFLSVSLYDKSFQDIAHFRIFPFTLSFFTFSQIVKLSITLYSPMTTLFIIKFVLDRMKTGGGVAC